MTFRPTHPLLQIVQRSLSGGFLTEDAALLNANARSMLEEAIATTTGVRAAPLKRAQHSAGRLYAVTKGARPEAGCELWEVAQTHRNVYNAHRSWSWPLRAIRPLIRALLILIRSQPLTSCSLAPRLRRASWPLSPITALASTCRFTKRTHVPRAAPSPVHVFLPQRHLACAKLGRVSVDTP